MAHKVAEAGDDPEVVLGRPMVYWAVDVLAACGLTVHLAHRWG